MTRLIKVLAVLMLFMGNMCIWTPAARADGCSGTASDPDMSGDGFRWLMEGQSWP